MLLFPEETPFWHLANLHPDISNFKTPMALFL
jgi:hypothetical protein